MAARENPPVHNYLVGQAHTQSRHEKVRRDVTHLEVLAIAVKNDMFKVRQLSSSSASRDIKTDQGRIHIESFLADLND